VTILFKDLGITLHFQASKEKKKIEINVA